MGFPKGLKRDFKRLEARRLRALELLDRGMSQAEAARRVGVHRQSVCRWAALKNQGGIGVLRHQRAGRRSRLSASQTRRLEKALREGSQKHGYSTPLWTARRIAEVIDRQTGVRFHEDHIYRLLQNLGWSCQRPVGRALERDEAKILEWKKRRWPAIKKKPSPRKESSSLSTKAD